MGHSSVQQRDLLLPESMLFPARTMCAHVTGWGKQSVKFRTDVAMMGKLGFDIGIAGLRKEEQEFCKEAVSNYKRLAPVILDGDLYRLVSPYETDHASLMYVGKDKSEAVLYAFDIHPRFGEKLFSVELQGSDPRKNYRVEEINRMPGEKSGFSQAGKTFSGDYLMKVGLLVLTGNFASSRILEITVR